MNIKKLLALLLCLSVPLTGLPISDVFAASKSEVALADPAPQIKTDAWIEYEVTVPVQDKNGIHPEVKSFFMHSSKIGSKKVEECVLFTKPDLKSKPSPYLLALDRKCAILKGDPESNCLPAKWKRTVSKKPDLKGSKSSEQTPKTTSETVPSKPKLPKKATSNKVDEDALAAYNGRWVTVKVENHPALTSKSPVFSNYSTYFCRAVDCNERKGELMPGKDRVGLAEKVNAGYNVAHPYKRAPIDLVSVPNENTRLTAINAAGATNPDAPWRASIDIVKAAPSDAPLPKEEYLRVEFGKTGAYYCKASDCDPNNPAAKINIATPSGEKAKIPVYIKADSDSYIFRNFVDNHFEDPAVRKTYRMTLSLGDDNKLLLTDILHPFAGTSEAVLTGEALEPEAPPAAPSCPLCPQQPQKPTKPKKPTPVLKCPPGTHKAKDKLGRTYCAEDEVTKQPPPPETPPAPPVANDWRQKLKEAFKDEKDIIIKSVMEELIDLHPEVLKEECKDAKKLESADQTAKCVGDLRDQAKPAIKELVEAGQDKTLFKGDEGQKSSFINALTPKFGFPADASAKTKNYLNLYYLCHYFQQDLMQTSCVEDSESKPSSGPELQAKPQGDQAGAPEQSPKKSTTGKCAEKWKTMKELLNWAAGSGLAASQNDLIDIKNQAGVENGVIAPPVSAVALNTACAPLKAVVGPPPMPKPPGVIPSPVNNECDKTQSANGNCGEKPAFVDYASLTAEAIVGGVMGAIIAAAFFAGPAGIALAALGGAGSLMILANTDKVGKAYNEFVNGRPDPAAGDKK